jgi:hypothetical protein
MLVTHRESVPDYLKPAEPKDGCGIEVRIHLVRLVVMLGQQC